MPKKKPRKGKYLHLGFLNKKIVLDVESSRPSTI